MRRRLERKKGAFDLGWFEAPVAVCALVWSVASLFVLVSTTEALAPALIVVGLLLVGGLFFLVMLKLDREALETEPGDVSAHKHWSKGRLRGSLSPCRRVALSHCPRDRGAGGAGGCRTPRCAASLGLASRGAGRVCRDQVVRWTLVLDAWARGRTTRRSTLTWAGRVIAQVMVSATSSALSGWSTPS